MKVTYFRISGYINILNGMGLHDLVINFSEFKNRIILIQGINGTGKSTIINTLKPDPDPPQYFRTDIFVDDNGNRQIIEYPAEKEIHYLDTDTGDVYKILIQSIVDNSKTKRTTKAFISKNDTELNPNGNVSSFKEIRNDMLGIDPIYLELSSISAENRGLVDLIPSERRKYMSMYIGSLDTYNNIFKVISKKANSIKSYMNTLNSKIYELGNESELRLKLMQLETTLKDLNKQRDKLLGDLAEAEAIVRIVDPENKMQDLYTSISDRLSSINNEMRENQEKYDRLHRNFHSSSDSPIIDIIKAKEEEIDKHRETIKRDTIKISTNISLNESTLSSIESDRNILAGLSSNALQSNIEEAVNKLSKEVKDYEEYLSKEDITILDSISLDELLDLRETLKTFLNEIACIEELYSAEVFTTAVMLSVNGNHKSIVEDLRNELFNISLEIEEIKKTISDIEENISIVDDFDNTRPKECKIDTCPYIAKYIKLKKSGDLRNNLDINDKKYKSLISKKEELERSIDFQSKLDELVIKLDKALTILYSKKNIISKIVEINKVLDPQYLIDKLTSFYRFPEFDSVTSVIEKYYIYKDLSEAREQLHSLQNDLNTYNTNKDLIASLNSSIEKNESLYDSRKKEIDELTRNCIFLEKVINTISEELEKLKSIKELTDEMGKLESDKEALKVEFDSVKENIRLVKEKMDSVNEIKNKILNVEESINPLSDTINQIKFNLSNIVGYQEEYQDISSKYDKIVFIRNACSPGNGLGIQSEYIKRYMNDIIIDCNKMLGYMFNGMIQLDVPIINEKQFSIPFLGPNGIVVPDIGQGSTAQKCMIGLVFGCVAMMKSSTKYNILRLDEIDGGLDQQNRIWFISVLNQILDFMRCEQCIICSHNNEFDTQSTTRIICSHEGIRFEQ